MWEESRKVYFTNGLIVIKENVHFVPIIQSDEHVWVWCDEVGWILRVNDLSFVWQRGARDLWVVQRYIVKPMTCLCTWAVSVVTAILMLPSPHTFGAARGRFLKQNISTCVQVLNCKVLQGARIYKWAWDLDKTERPALSRIQWPLCGLSAVLPAVSELVNYGSKIQTSFLKISVYITDEFSSW